MSKEQEVKEVKEGKQPEVVEEVCDVDCRDGCDEVKALKAELEKQEKFYTEQRAQDIKDYNRLAKAFNTLLKEYNELHVKVLLTEDSK